MLFIEICMFQQTRAISKPFFPEYSGFHEGFNCPLPYANYVTFTCRKVDRETK